jgi:hypothetical protein
MQNYCRIVACTAGEVDASSVSIWPSPPSPPAEVGGECRISQPQVARKKELGIMTAVMVSIEHENDGEYHNNNKNASPESCMR